MAQETRWYHSNTMVKAKNIQWVGEWTWLGTGTWMWFAEQTTSTRTIWKWGVCRFRPPTLWMMKATYRMLRKGHWIPVSTTFPSRVSKTLFSIPTRKPTTPLQNMWTTTLGSHSSGTGSSKQVWNMLRAVASMWSLFRLSTSPTTRLGNKVRKPISRKWLDSSAKTRKWLASAFQQETRWIATKHRVGTMPWNHTWQKATHISWRARSTTMQLSGRKWQRMATTWLPMSSTTRWRHSWRLTMVCKQVFGGDSTVFAVDIIAKPHRAAVPNWATLRTVATGPQPAFIACQMDEWKHSWVLQNAKPNPPHSKWCHSTAMLISMAMALTEAIQCSSLPTGMALINPRIRRTLSDWWKSTAVRMCLHVL